ncbi:MAG: cytochrome c [Cyclobacteriaceae bacterium]
MKYYGYLVIIIICFITISAFRQSFDLKASITRGKEVYVAQCLSCHMDEGQGLEDVYPPLAKSDYLMADKKRPIREILYGLNGPIKVNGKTYDLEMTGFDLTDQEASDVLNYIRNSWGNKGAAVTPDEVRASRTK